jgi:hypothetical protein
MFSATIELNPSNARETIIVLENLLRTAREFAGEVVRPKQTPKAEPEAIAEPAPEAETEAKPKKRGRPKKAAGTRRRYVRR